jgi:hypothetical protein
VVYEAEKKDQIKILPLCFSSKRAGTKNYDNSSYLKDDNPGGLLKDEKMAR